MIAAVLLALTLAPQSADGPIADPLAPARAGKVRCVAPQAERRNCRTIVRFTDNGDGTYNAEIASLLDANRNVIVIYDSFGTVDGERVCATMKPTEFSGGRFFIGAKAATGSQLAQLREDLVGRMADLMGQRRCFIDEAVGGSIVSHVTMNGIGHPEMEQRARWVDRSEGWALGE